YLAALHASTPGFERDLASRAIAFYADELYLLRGDELTLIDVPESAEAGLHRQWLTVELREDWQVGGHTYVGGSLLVIELEAFLAGDRDFQELYVLSASTSLAGSTCTRHHKVVNILSDVKCGMQVTPYAGGWEAGT